jgi:hypothetical protein
MQKYKAPDKPTGFDAAVQQHRDVVYQAIQANTKPNFKESVWKGYKNQLSAALHRKCGFCEVIATGASYGDVEHYHPKGAIWEITTPGEEARNLANVAGRGRRVLADSGYHWLAYEWTNWLLSCEICNRGWKRSYFPVLETDRSLPPGEQDEETPLLLNPFGRKNPAKHLQFGRLGEVEPRNSSEFGRATIDVCGLNRPSLRDARLEKAERTFVLIDRMFDEDNQQRVDDALEDLVRMGREDTAHCGMVRAIFEEETGIPWSELEDSFG